MKKIFLSLLVALVACNSFTCSAFDIKEALGKVLSSDSTSTTTSSIGSVISAVIGSQKVELKDLVGTWKYSTPAVSFKSDNPTSRRCCCSLKHRAENTSFLHSLRNHKT